MDKKFLTKNMNYILMAVGLIAIAYVLYVYNGQKNTNSMSAGVPNGSNPTDVWNGRNASQTPSPAQPLGKIEGPQATDAKTNFAGAGCSPSMVSDPAELLPNDVNSQWSTMNPRGGGQLESINLLSAGSMIGINTIGSSLRNANLQLRSEPANPQLSVGPWNQSTIQPDIMRVPLEIGQGCS
jgi:hypothetical protein